MFRNSVSLPFDLKPPICHTHTLFCPGGVGGWRGGWSKAAKKTPHREAQTHFTPLKLDALVYIGECNLKLPFLPAWSPFFVLSPSNIHKFSDLS